MQCPKCGFFNPDSAQRCDCGFDFLSHIEVEIKEISLNQKWMGIKGGFALALVLIVAGSFMVYGGRRLEITCQKEMKSLPKIEGSSKVDFFTGRVTVDKTARERPSRV